MPVTQKDIARHLGLSQSRVAGALKGYGDVAPATRELVLATAREMGYTAHSNQSARTLVGQRYGRRAATGVVGYISASGEIPQRHGMHLYWAQLQAGVQEAVGAAGMAMLFLGEGLAGIACDKIDGLLTTCNPNDVRGHLNVDMPWVSMLMPHPGIPSVVADEEAGIGMAMRHLLELGHRRIGFLVGAGSWDWHHESRLAAYRDSLRAAGIEPLPRWVRHLLFEFPADTGFQGSGYRRMGEWLREGWRDLGLTALLTQNDQAAMGAIAALQEAGFRVPEDVSVVGFDGTEASECCTPRLTTVEVPLRAIGARGAGMLLSLLAGNDVAPEPVMLPVRLAIRESTKEKST